VARPTRLPRLVSATTEDSNPDAASDEFAVLDVLTMVAPGDRVHVLHGGTSDGVASRNLAAHLQGSWRGAVVAVDGAPRFAQLVAALQAWHSREDWEEVVVVVPAAVVAQAPMQYDALTALPGTTVIVDVPVTACLGGEPYSSRAGLVAIAVSSCRVVPPSDVEAALTMYRFPKRVAAGASFLHRTPHDTALCWKLDGAMTTPAFVTHTSPVQPTVAQHALERALWWVPQTWLPTVPAVPVAFLHPDFVLTPGIAPFLVQGSAPPGLGGTWVLDVAGAWSKAMAGQGTQVQALPPPAHIVLEDGMVIPVGARSMSPAELHTPAGVCRVVCTSHLRPWFTREPHRRRQVTPLPAPAPVWKTASHTQGRIPTNPGAAQRRTGPLEPFTL